jgi:hypothetical protein
MLSNKWVCPHCLDEKPNQEAVFTQALIDTNVFHFFCTQCGQGYRVAVQDGQYSLEPIRVGDAD